MPVVSITRLRVRSVRHLPAFLWYAFRSGRQAAKAEGNIAARVMNDRNRTFWTATVWTTDAAMKNFMMAGPHRDAMRKLLEWCDEAALVHWDQEIEQPPRVARGLPAIAERRTPLESESSLCRAYGLYICRAALAARYSSQVTMIDSK